MDVKELLKELKILEKAGKGEYLVGIIDPGDYRFFDSIERYSVQEPDDEHEVGVILFEVF